METYIYNKRFGTPVHRTILSSGVNVFTAPLSSRRVHHQVTFPAGACHGKFPGTAHYAEHLVLNGPNNDHRHPALIPLYPKGVNIHGSTYSLWTDYPAIGFAEDFGKIHRSLIEICLHSAIETKHVESERGVILQEELGSRYDDVEYRCNQYAYPDNPRLHIANVGTAESIELIDAEAINQLIHEAYTFNQASFFCVGGIPHEEHVAAVIQSAEAAHDSQKRAPTQKAAFPLTLSKVSFEVRKNNNQAKLEIFFRAPDNEPDLTLLCIAMDLLQRPPNGILWRNLRAHNSLAYSFSANVCRPPRHRLSIQVAASKENLRRAGFLIWEGIEELQENRYSQELFDAVRADWRRYFLKRSEVPETNLIDAIQYFWHQQESIDLDQETLVASTTREQIAEIAKTYLRREEHGFAEVRPET